MTTRFIARFTAALVLAAAVVAVAEPRGRQSAAVHEFKQAVRQYVALHRQIEQAVLPLRVTGTAEGIREPTDALRAAIQTVRAGAREGDMFTPEIAAHLRVRIAESLTANGFQTEELLASNLEEADERAAVPVVNGRFPWGRGALMWPCVLDVLPELPQELQYRFVGRDLVLLDTHADLVVDILREAIR